MMSEERWREIERLFHGASERDDEERERWLAGECGDDTGLRRQIERMLAADARDANLLDGAALAEHGADLEGAVIGPWCLDEKIAEGGIGTVYRAHRVDGAFSRPVAVKLLGPGIASATLHQRFLREPRVLGKLEHPDIARLLDGGTTSAGVPYLVMELVSGRPIDRYCDDHRLGLRGRVLLVLRVCAAVDHAHRALVVHRDLKPGNVLVTDRGDPRVVDFGVAALLAERDDGAPVAFTPAYAAPEQVRGAEVSIAADVWSLGVLLYELLVGLQPFRSDTIRALAADQDAVATWVPPSAAFAKGAAGARERARTRGAAPRWMARRLRGDLDAVVARALAVDPAARYASCRDLAADLERWLGGHPVTARPRGAIGRARALVARHKVVSVLSAALLATMVTGTVLSIRWARAAEDERRAAEIAAEHAGVEAESAAQITSSLVEVFLNEQLVAGEDSLARARDRLLAEAEMLRRLHDDDPRVAANVLDGLGRAATRIALFDVAESLIHDALELRTARLGDDDAERGLSFTSLGALAYQRGDPAASRAAFEESLRIQRADPMSVHTDLARAYNDLAAATSAAGDPEAALVLHREALAIRRARDPNSPQVAESLNNLSVTLARLGRVDEARETLDEAIRLRRARLGDRATLTLQSIGNRGALALSEGDLVAARRDLSEAVDGLRELRSAGADGLIVFLPKLAAVATDLGDVQASARHLDEALCLAEEVFGAVHPRTADVLGEVARLQERRGDVELAISTWGRALTARRAALPAGHPKIATTLNNLALARADAGDVAGAIVDLRECLELRADDPFAAARTRYAIGVVLINAGLGDEAVAELERALGDLSGTSTPLRLAVEEALDRARGDQRP